MVDFIQYPKIVKARKSHTCSWCGEEIAKNEKYEVSFLKSDGVYSWKSHLSCRDLTEELDMFYDVGYEGLTADEFSTHIFEWFRENHTAEEYEDVSFKDALSSARRELLEDMEQYGGDEDK